MTALSRRDSVRGCRPPRPRIVRPVVRQACNAVGEQASPRIAQERECPRRCVRLGSRSTFSSPLDARQRTAVLAHPAETAYVTHRTSVEFSQDRSRSSVSRYCVSVILKLNGSLPVRRPAHPVCAPSTTMPGNIVEVSLTDMLLVFPTAGARRSQSASSIEDRTAQCRSCLPPGSSPVTAVHRGRWCARMIVFRCGKPTMQRFPTRPRRTRLSISFHGR